MSNAHASATATVAPTEAMSISRRYAVALVALIAFGAVLRFATLDTQSFYLDETVTAWLMQKSFWGMLAALPGSESAPPLYYVLLWPWAKLWGTGEVGLRSFSALVGTAAIPIAYAVAARLASKRAGLITAALVTVNPLLVWYSQEARVYALFVTLAALSLLAFAAALREPGPRTVALWCLASAAAVLTHYFAVFLIVAEAVILYRASQARGRLLLAFAGLAAVGAALLPLAIAQRGGTEWITSNPLPQRVADTGAQYLIGPDAPAPALLGFLAAALVVAGIWLVFYRTAPEERRAAKLVAVVGAAGVAGPFLLALGGLDVFLQKSMIGSLVPLIVALAIGLGGSRSGRTGLAVLGALCALGLGIVAAVDEDSTLQRDDWRGAAQMLGGSGANRMLVVNPGDAGPPHHQAIVYYIPAAHATTCRRPVRELDLLSLEDNGLDAQVQGVPKLPRIPTPAGFRMVGRSETSRFTLIRYRSATAHASCEWLGAARAALDESGRGKAKPVLIPAGAEPKRS
jgi:mannosyltransferase